MVTARPHVYCSHYVTRNTFTTNSGLRSKKYQGPRPDITRSGNETIVSYAVHVYSSGQKEGAISVSFRAVYSETALHTALILAIPGRV